ncbi:cytochrome-c peroxidase [Shewanella nanhaiensis]|uniref:C-type cytochrome n=1 Tax=Shewanella nanhaiensis TaxID=2864872 RepID=A0ABS7EAA7_9GAMM|nr:cytochrome c peroxidase [Shewanella nanhaiensis]MBW8186618.1 c-type cytochrome [Shewanella nanhaiensis]
MRTAIVCLGLLLSSTLDAIEVDYQDYVFVAGHESLQHWLLPSSVPTPADNPQTSEKIALGKMLFFDPRLSGDSNMSCATCHNPMLGWSDNQKVALGYKSQKLTRSTPQIINAAYNHLQMWDGRLATLEEQALAPMEAKLEMHANLEAKVALLQSIEGYVTAFNLAFPGEAISKQTMAKAIASFERTVISNNSNFDAWVKGDKNALTAIEITGFKLFINPDKGNCSVCHSAPNFTDDGFHNIGLASFGDEHPDLGRYKQRPLNLMKGAFKTPTLRDIALSAPFFHDGSATTLTQVVRHYSDGGIVKTNLSPNFKANQLSKDEISAIVAFLNTLTSPHESVQLPKLPQ